MQAVWYEDQGAARDVLVLGEMDTPGPAAGEVLVQVHASGCNPSDVKLRAGARPMGFARIIPHSDAAGVIEAVGHGVDAARIGQRVWLWNGQWQRAFGTCAQYIALPGAQAVPLPEAISFAQGACLGIPAMTAYACVFADGPVAGQKVLVTGGAGTVARYAIQMAKLAGAQVLTTVSSELKAAYARAAGADFVLNYKEPGLVERIMDATGGVDRIVELEFGANLGVSEKIIKPGGVIAAYGSSAVMEPVLPFYPLMFKNVTLRMLLVYLLSDAVRNKTLAGLTDMLKTGDLSHAIAHTFDFSQAVAAHEMVESGNKMGSVVVAL
jgi:NADPH:quinone reductase